MHASAVISLVLIASSLALALPLDPPRDSHPHLQRRQFPLISTVVGSVAVHKARDNRQTITDYQTSVQQLRQQADYLNGREQLLARTAPQLVRRQFGMVLGAVGIHKSRDNRKDMGQLDQDIAHLRSDTDALLQAEHLPATTGGIPPPPEEDGGDSRLQRRQLGIILSPIATQMARTDRKRLDAMGPELDQIRIDLARVSQAQDFRMHAMQGEVPNGGGGRWGNPSALTSVSGVMASNSALINGPTVMSSSSSLPRSGGGNYGHSSSYHAPTSYSTQVDVYN